jgi:hypothetical protein
MKNDSYSQFATELAPDENCETVLDGRVFKRSSRPARSQLVNRREIAL